MATLGELYDTASMRLSDVAQIAHALGTSHRAALVCDLERLISGLQTIPSPSTRPEQVPPAASDFTALLGMAQREVGAALRLLPEPDPSPVSPARVALDEAIHAVSAVRDVIESHRTADRIPITAYAYTFSAQPAIDYLTLRTADLALHAGRVSSRLANGADPANAADALMNARRYLNQAAVFGRAGAQGADMAAGAFPLALPVEPVQANSDDPAHQLPGRLADDCERLSRAAFETLHDRADHRLSGSDLRELARWTAMNRFLAGRLLLQVAEQHPDTSMAGALKSGADHLRDAGRAWKEAAAGWRRTVDVADPRVHPELPLPSYELVRRGHAVKLPRVVPHSATVITHTSVIRVGRLLYGPKWGPEDAAGPPGAARQAGEILADMRGEGRLAATLYRLPATGRQLAVAVPVAIQRAAVGLVTDVPEHRPATIADRYRWYPVQEHQVATLCAAYGAVDRAEGAAAATLLHIAERAGIAVPRARLDAAAHRQLVAGPDQQWAPDRARVRQQDRAAAARARSTGVSGRHVLPPPALGPRPANPAGVVPPKGRGHSW